ncbi:MAG: ShlB/FhaC/HecB family hemolysin secretion/activation protein, partial [Rhodoferax sp.]|nr:ShlB/FhaC/HecB family hemolysin secretion/activation protein [Rhodoferax sp.]
MMLLAASCTAAAQTVPDAGALQKQAEQSLKFQAPPALASRPHAAPPAMKKEGEQTVTVVRFELTGNMLLSSEVLGKAVEPFLNRPLSFAELQQSAEAVAMAYRDAGWIVRAYLPQQAIAQGVVTIHVIEAVFGAVRMQGEPATHVDASQLTDIVDGVLRKGDPLSARGIDRALLLLDDLPGVSVVGNLVEGRERSETDLALIATDEAWVVGNVAYDNAGSTSTGKERLSANFVLNSPLRLGDAFTTNLLKTEGSE